MFKYFLEKILDKRLGKGWLRFNIQSAIMSIAIAGFITILFAIHAKTNEKHLNINDFLITLLYSTCISFSIGNSIKLTYVVTSLKKQKPIIENIIVLSLMAFGMFFGFTIASFFHALIEHRTYSFVETFTDISYFPFIIGLSIGFVSMRYNSLKEEMTTKLKEKEIQIVKLNEQNTQSQLQSLQAKINPHFLYNALNSIASLIHEDQDKAEEMTLNLSKFFRYSINRSDEQWATLRDEIEMVNTYLNIEKLRFEDRLQIKVHVLSHLEDVSIPRFLLQPLVENSIKHGISKITEQAIIRVSVKDKGNHIEITVHDNGPMFPKDIQMGYGIKSLHDKLHLLYATGYEIEIMNKPNKEIRLLLPKEK